MENNKFRNADATFLITSLIEKIRKKGKEYLSLRFFLWGIFLCLLALLGSLVFIWKGVFSQEPDFEFISIGLVMLIWGLAVGIILYKNRKGFYKTCSSNKKQNEDFSPSALTSTHLLDSTATGDPRWIRAALAAHPEHLNTAYEQNGNTPLHVAALNGYAEIVRLLLQQPGIDKTRKNKDGKTALDLAQEKNFTEIAELLK